MMEASKNATKTGAFFAKVKKFLREVKAELKKVIWPTRKELITHTGVVLSIVVLVSLFIYFADTIIASVPNLFSK